MISSEEKGKQEGSEEKASDLFRRKLFSKIFSRNPENYPERQSLPLFLYEVQETPYYSCSFS